MGYARFFSFEAFGVPSPFDPIYRYVTSPVFPPVVLSALRLIFALYTLATFVITIAVHSNSYFSYFTHLSLIGLTAYFWASTVQTIAFVRCGRKSYPLQTWPRFFQLLHVVLYSTIIVYPIIVTTTFWILLARSDAFASSYRAWDNISLHAMNSFFALFEVLFTHGGPSPWTHLVPLALMLMSYLGVVYITYDTQGFYTYSFLDPAREGPVLAAYIIGTEVGCCFLFAVLKGICTLRERISLRYGSSAGRSRPSDELPPSGSIV